MAIQRIKKLKLRTVSCATHYTWRTPQLQVLYSQTATLQLQWLRGIFIHPKHIFLNTKPILKHIFS